MDPARSGSLQGLVSSTSKIHEQVLNNGSSSLGSSKKGMKIGSPIFGFESSSIGSENCGVLMMEWGICHNSSIMADLSNEVPKALSEGIKKLSHNIGPNCRGISEWKKLIETSTQESSFLPSSSALKNTIDTYCPSFFSTAISSINVYTQPILDGVIKRDEVTDINSNEFALKSCTNVEKLYGDENIEIDDSNKKIVMIPLSTEWSNKCLSAMSFVVDSPVLDWITETIDHSRESNENSIMRTHHQLNMDEFYCFFKCIANEMEIGMNDFMKRDCSFPLQQTLDSMIRVQLPALSGTSKDKISKVGSLCSWMAPLENEIKTTLFASDLCFLAYDRKKDEVIGRNRFTAATSAVFARLMAGVSKDASVSHLCLTRAEIALDIHVCSLIGSTANSIALLPLKSSSNENIIGFLLIGWERIPSIEAMKRFNAQLSSIGSLLVKATSIHHTLTNIIEKQRIQMNDLASMTSARMDLQNDRDWQCRVASLHNDWLPSLQKCRSLSELSVLISDKLFPLLRCSRSKLCFVGKEGSCYTIQGSSKLRVRDEITVTIIREQKSLALSNISHDPEWSNVSSTVFGSGLPKSIIGSPVVSQNKVVAILFGADSDNNGFKANDHELMNLIVESFARQLSLVHSLQKLKRNLSESQKSSQHYIDELLEELRQTQSNLAQELQDWATVRSTSLQLLSEAYTIRQLMKIINDNTRADLVKHLSNLTKLDNQSAPTDCQLWLLDQVLPQQLLSDIHAGPESSTVDKPIPNTLWSLLPGVSGIQRRAISDPVKESLGRGEVALLPLGSNVCFDDMDINTETSNGCSICLPLFLPVSLAPQFATNEKQFEILREKAFGGASLTGKLNSEEKLLSAVLVLTCPNTECDESSTSTCISHLQRFGDFLELALRQCIATRLASETVQASQLECVSKTEELNERQVESNVLENTIKRLNKIPDACNDLVYNLMQVSNTTTDSHLEKRVETISVFSRSLEEGFARNLNAKGCKIFFGERLDHFIHPTEVDKDFTKVSSALWTVIGQRKLLQYPLCSGVVGFTHSQSISVKIDSNVKDDCRFAERMDNVQSSSNLQNMLTVPLIVGEVSLGVLQFWDNEKGFSKADERNASLICSSLASSLYGVSQKMVGEIYHQKEQASLEDNKNGTIAMLQSHCHEGQQRISALSQRLGNTVAEMGDRQLVGSCFLKWKTQTTRSLDERWRWMTGIEKLKSVAQRWRGSRVSAAWKQWRDTLLVDSFKADLAQSVAGSWARLTRPPTSSLVGTGTSMNMGSSRRTRKSSNGDLGSAKTKSLYSQYKASKRLSSSKGRTSNARAGKSKRMSKNDMSMISEEDPFSSSSSVIRPNSKQQQQQHHPTRSLRLGQLQSSINREQQQQQQQPLRLGAQMQRRASSSGVINDGNSTDRRNNHNHSNIMVSSPSQQKSMNVGTLHERQQQQQQQQQHHYIPSVPASSVSDQHHNLTNSMAGLAMGNGIKHQQVIDASHDDDINQLSISARTEDIMFDNRVISVDNDDYDYEDDDGREDVIYTDDDHGEGADRLSMMAKAALSASTVSRNRKSTLDGTPSLKQLKQMFRKSDKEKEMMKQTLKTLHTGILEERADANQVRKQVNKLRSVIRKQEEKIDHLRTPRKPSCQVCRDNNLYGRSSSHSHHHGKKTKK
eukprot:TRINITY_DN449_c2_g1_i1.p1 TRINITY_DN449_c2_g1~~TRINITY_DN449_c2_g1_i1.p1  ORF type:complete len:1653 (+),score=580.99 TRINITY_DN449_c2_g1_i1:181-5139(+)